MNRIIQNQTTLSSKIILNIAMQGIKIRLERSIITILGIALGISFLMSVMTSNLIKQAVNKESQTRKEVSRMMNFLTAELGTVAEKKIAILQTSPLSDTEIRFINLLAKSNCQLYLIPKNKNISPFPAKTDGAIKTSFEPDSIQDATAVIVAGDLPQNFDPSKEIPNIRSNQIALLRHTDKIPNISNKKLICLSRQPTEDELKKIEANMRKDKIRNIWVIIISLIVTVIGIANSMLMSVTERFREIGTMKCLGALSSFIRKLFFIESVIIGGAGALFGTLFGIAVPIAVNAFSFNVLNILASLDWKILLIYSTASFAIGIILSSIAAIYPALFASKMLPSNALRSDI